MYLLMKIFLMSNKTDDELFDLIYGPIQLEYEHENIPGITLYDLLFI